MNGKRFSFFLFILFGFQVLNQSLASSNKENTKNELGIFRKYTGKPYVDVPYLQPISERFTLNGTQIGIWKQLPFSSPIQQVLSADYLGPKSFYILTENSLVQFTEKEIKRIDLDLGINVVNGSRIVTFFNQGIFKLIYLNPQRLFICTPQENKCETSQQTPNDLQFIYVLTYFKAMNNIQNPFIEYNELNLGVDQFVLLIASQMGFYSFDLNSYQWKKIEFPISGPTVCVAALDEITVAVAVSLNDKQAGNYGLLYRYHKGKWIFFRTPGIIDDIPTSLKFDVKSRRLHISTTYALVIQLPNLSFLRIGAQQGLPYGNLTSLVIDKSGFVWIGSNRGLFRWKEGNSRFKFFYGPRWLPGKILNGPNMNVGMYVKSITVLNDTLDSIVVATDSGLAIITYEWWSLEKKANYLQSLVYPRHDRYGLIARCILEEFGNLDKYVLYTTDNDGGYTSSYVASQAYRYATTKDPEAQQMGLKSFYAIEFLINVTSITGLVSRSVNYGKVPNPPDGIWYPSKLYNNWYWKGDCSADEVTWDLWSTAVAHDLLATSPSDKQRARKLICDVTRYIIQNNYTLIDYSGKPTTWGHWGPQDLNWNETWEDDRGHNSIQILAWTLAAYHFCNDSFFLSSAKDLVETHGYDLNIINAKITQPDDYIYFDEGLTWIPYLHYMYYGNNFLGEAFNISVERSSELEKKDRNSLYNLIYILFKNEPIYLDGAIATLQEWPTEQIRWTIFNSNRYDIVVDVEKSYPATTTILPYDEIGVLDWGDDPYSFQAQNIWPNNGMSEQAPSHYLLAYWFARYHGIIVNN